MCSYGDDSKQMIQANEAVKKFCAASSQLPGFLKVGECGYVYMGEGCPYSLQKRPCDINSNTFILEFYQIVVSAEDQRGMSRRVLGKAVIMGDGCSRCVFSSGGLVFHFLPRLPTSVLFPVYSWFFYVFVCNSFQKKKASLERFPNVNMAIVSFLSTDFWCMIVNFYFSWSDKKFRMVYILYISWYLSYDPACALYWRMSHMYWSCRLVIQERRKFKDINILPPWAFFLSIYFQVKKSF